MRLSLQIRVQNAQLVSHSDSPDKGRAKRKGRTKKKVETTTAFLTDDKAELHEALKMGRTGKIEISTETKCKRVDNDYRLPSKPIGSDRLSDDLLHEHEHQRPSIRFDPLRRR